MSKVDAGEYHLFHDAKNRVTVAATTINGVEIVGSARCAEPDVFDEVVGANLAVSRLWKKVARQLEKDARAVVEDRDRIRNRQRQAAQEALQRRIERSESYRKPKEKSKKVKVKNNKSSKGSYPNDNWTPIHAEPIKWDGNVSVSHRVLSKNDEPYYSDTNGGK